MGDLFALGAPRRRESVRSRLHGACIFFEKDHRQACPTRQPTESGRQAGNLTGIMGKFVNTVSRIATGTGE